MTDFLHKLKDFTRNTTKEVYFNSSLFLTRHPLSIEIVDPDACFDHDAVDVVEAFVSLFAPGAGSERILEPEGIDRVQNYCETLGLHLSRKRMLTAKAVRRSRDYDKVFDALFKKVQERAAQADAPFGLAGFLDHVAHRFVRGEREAAFEGSNHSVVPAGVTAVRTRGVLFTYSQFHCVAVIAKAGDEVLLAHLKVGHHHTKRAQKGLQGLEAAVRALAAKSQLELYVIADNATLMAHQILKRIRQFECSGKAFVHVKNPAFVYAVAAGYIEGGFAILHERHLAEMARWWNWCETAATMPYSAVDKSLDFQLFSHI